MSLPLIAIVGRPNVGKSTLINRIAQAREAITHKMPGVTRDRKYIQSDWEGKVFTMIDTGGIQYEKNELLSKIITEQAELAIEEADAILMLVDAKEGVNPLDEEIASFIRKSKKPVLVVVNKIDDVGKTDQKMEFYKMGLGEPYAISAMHGLGIADLLDDLVSLIPKVKVEPETLMLSVAICGRPNSGKSSLLNKLLGAERVVVSDLPGTTRDTIDSIVEIDKTKWRFIDTAGIKRKKVGDLDYYGLVRALQALDRADIALSVIDAKESVTEQDQRVIELALNRGCAVIILLNKWDLVSEEHVKALKRDTARRLKFIGFAPLLNISALSGEGLKKLFKVLSEVGDEYQKKIKTSDLVDFVQKLDLGKLPVKGGKKLKIKYGSQVGTKPPRFVFFVNMIEIISAASKRFLENQLRERFGFLGCPIEISFKRKK